MASGCMHVLALKLPCSRPKISRSHQMLGRQMHSTPGARLGRGFLADLCPCCHRYQRHSRGVVALRALHETLHLHQATADLVHSQPLQALLSLADAAALSADSAASATSAASNALNGATADGTVDAAAQTAQRAGGWFGFISDGLETVLDYIQSALQQLHVPYTYGWSIILLTCAVKLALLPVTKIQVDSSIAMQNLKPTIDNIKRLYGDDKDKVQRETTALYEKAGVKPLAGCLPSLATIPIFIGLYQSLSNVANSGQLDTEGFYWLPSLAAPTTLAARRAGTSTAWLFPFVDGHPPIGWEDASKYLVLPVLLVVAQYVSSALISPPVDPNDENAKTSQRIVAFLPLMVGWFALQVPSGLSLYYLANTILTSTQQVALRKLGGESALPRLGEVTVGKARRTGKPATEDQSQLAYSSAEGSMAAPAVSGSEQPSGNGAVPLESIDEDAIANGAVMTASAVSAQEEDDQPRPINRRCKRKKREYLDFAV